jgi:hypothetical protein
VDYFVNAKTADNFLPSFLPHLQAILLTQQDHFLHFFSEVEGVLNLA